MGLTSRASEYTAVGIALLCLAFTVWHWPRLARQGVMPVLGRVGLIGVTQLAILAAFALGVNARFDFYGSWGELVGRGPTAQGKVTDFGERSRYTGAGPAVGGLIEPAGPQGLDKAEGLPSGRADRVGRVESVKVLGRRSHAVNPAFVYLPPQYFQKQYHRQRFPVIVAISGYPGGIMNLAQHLQVPRTAARLLRTGRMQPTVIVMIRPTIAPPRDTECVDVPGGPQAETFFTKDLPEALKRTYRVGHDPSAWGALGYSSGGTCALQLAMRDPGVYTSAAALSPDYRIKNDLTTGNLFGHGPQAEFRQQGHDLMWRLEHLPAPRISVLVATSRSGEREYGATMRFLRAVRPPMVSARIVLAQGSHHFTTWRREISPAMEWMGRQLTFPQDTAPATPKAASHPVNSRQQGPTARPGPRGPFPD